MMKKHTETSGYLRIISDDPVPRFTSPYEYDVTAGGTVGVRIDGFPIIPVGGEQSLKWNVSTTLSPSLFLGEEPKIEVGDTVCLKSGGPLMTVGEIDNWQRANCIWFDEGDSAKEHYFNLSVLELADVDSYDDEDYLDEDKFNIYSADMTEKNKIVLKYNGSPEQMEEIHCAMCNVMNAVVGKNYATIGVKVVSTYDKKEWSGMIEVSVPNDLLEKMMTSKVGLINKISSKCQSNNKISTDGDDEIVPDFEEIVKQTEKSKSEVIPVDKRKVLESGLDGKTANETDLAEWFSSVFIEYNPIRMSMNIETYSKLFGVFEGSFDDAGDLWGVKTEVDWDGIQGYEDYEIIFTYEA